ncbi:MAG: TIGR03089 family protein, partial [Jatrophihabitantaceae bacterium]
MFSAASSDKSARSPESLFNARRQDEPTAPFVTFYDDATGERAELSASSLGNWIAKVHFLLLDSLGLGVGDQAVVRTPVHWLAAPILFGCWFAGLEVLTSPPTDRAAVLFADAGSLAELAAGAASPAGPAAPAGSALPADEVFAVSLLSMARPDQPPAGAEDFTTAVRPMPDAWPSVQPQAGPDAAGLDGLSRSQLVERGQQLAAELGLRPGGRLLWTTD